MLLASGAIGAGQDIWSRGKGLRDQILWQLGQRGAGPPCIPHPMARHCSHASPDPLGRDEGAECQGGGLGHADDASKGRCRCIPGMSQARAVLRALLTGRFLSGPSSSSCCPTHPRVSGSLINFLGFPACVRSLAPSRTWQAGGGWCVPSFLPEGHNCSAWGDFSLFYTSCLCGWAELCVQTLPCPQHSPRVRAGRGVPAH